MRDLCISGLFCPPEQFSLQAKKHQCRCLGCTGKPGRLSSNCDQSTVPVREQPAVRNRNAVT